MQWYFPLSILHLWKVSTVCEGTESSVKPKDKIYGMQGRQKKPNFSKSHYANPFQMSDQHLLG